MSVYRQGVSVSWSTQMEQGNYKENLIRHHNAMKKMFRAFSKDTNHRYDKAVRSAFKRMDFLTYLNTKQYREAKQREYRRYYRELPLRTRFFVDMELYCPWIYKGLQKLWYAVRSKG